MEWIESIWQLCVDKSDDFKDHDDWKPGHKLLKYLVNVALTLHLRSFSISLLLLQLVRTIALSHLDSRL